MRLVWTETAIANLVEIREYVAQDKPVAARRLAQRILSCAKRLAKYPHLGRAGRELDTRELLVGGTPYFICYQVHRERVAILAVVHGARERGEQ
jgi:toxin ParE1/3/4